MPRTYRYPNSFAHRCQRRPLSVRLGTILALFAVSAALAAEPAPIVRPERDDFLQRFSRMHFGGSLSLNWRNLGPRRPGFETQIQNEVYLADMYFGIDGPFIDGVPFQVEWNMPTAGRGSLQLNQLNFGYKRVDDVLLQFGKFLVPFGRYNELYRPDQFLAVTRPLLYASPDSLDLVVRLNSPRPPVSAGYTDIGARASYYPPFPQPWIPQELTFFVVNGLGENNNRQRTFPNVDFLGIPGVPGNGANIDFGHENNDLADNNNTKSVGGRAVFSIGDIRFPWPIPEGASDLKGVNLGVSGMGGQYDLESSLNYQMYGLDLTFDYLGFNFSGEYVWSVNQFLAPRVGPAGAIVVPTEQLKDFEINRGYFVQTSFPILRTPAVGQRLTGVLVYNQLFRRGPIEDLLLNQTIDGVTYPSVVALRNDSGRTTTRMDKYTAGLNYQLTDHFVFKLDYSYWVMAHASTRSTTSFGLVDIYQTAFSMVMGF